MTTAAESAKDSPVAWFVVLDVAREKNDHERAAEALRQLRRLGVSVRYSPRPREAAQQ